MPIVYVPSNPQRYDKERNRLVPKYDMSPASVWGELHIEDDVPMTGDDYIVVAGDIAKVAVAIARALREHGHVNILRWDNRTQLYKVTQVKEE